MAKNKDEFFISRATRYPGFVLRHNGSVVGTFGTVDAAADLAVRHAQDLGLASYALYLP